MSVGGVRFYVEGHEAELEHKERVTEIIKFSWPYGYISRGQGTLERVHEERMRKYLRLARSLKQPGREDVRITGVIVSLMGAASNQLLKDLQKVLRCSD
jgi:hypothetical protein